MRVRHTILVVLAAVLTSYSQSVQQDQSTLTVYGTGILELPANRAFIGFTVKGFGPTIGDAVEVTRQKLHEVTSKLFVLGLTGKNLTTSSLNSGDNFEGKAFLSSSRDFRTLVNVQVTVDSLEILNPIIVALAGSQLEQLSNVSFGLKNDSTMKLEVRRLAVLNAQEKAGVMARQLGISLGKPVQVEELLSYSDGDFYLPPRTGAIERNYTTSVAVGGGGVVFYGAQKFTIKSGVRIVYEIRK